MNHVKKRKAILAALGDNRQLTVSEIAGSSDLSAESVWDHLPAMLSARLVKRWYSLSDNSYVYFVPSD